MKNYIIYIIIILIISCKEKNKTLETNLYLNRHKLDSISNYNLLDSLIQINHVKNHKILISKIKDSLFKYEKYENKIISEGKGYFIKDKFIKKSWWINYHKKGITKTEYIYLNKKEEKNQIININNKGDTLYNNSKYYTKSKNKNSIIFKLHSNKNKDEIYIEKLYYFIFNKNNKLLIKDSVIGKIIKKDVIFNIKYSFNDYLIRGMIYEISDNKKKNIIGNNTVFVIDTLNK